MSASSRINSSEQDNKHESCLSRHHRTLIIILIISTVVLLGTSIGFGLSWGKEHFYPGYQKFAVENGTIGSPPILPNDGEYIQWTILHLNDVYEMLPLDQGKKGGLARVAHVRQLLKEENSQTLTILSGDFLSPSALGIIFNGKQMIQTFNTLGLDYVTFGNHEFDLNQTELISRMNESNFTWISSNVFDSKTNQSFSSSIAYKIVTINQVRILFIGLTIDVQKDFVRIISQTSLIPFVQQFLKSIPAKNYDVLVALTHLDMATDIKLSENIPEIDLILGGHEHEDYFLLRGAEYTPIYKADGNAFTVYIHRCALNLNTKRLRVYSTLTKITSEIPEETKTKTVANQWYNSGIEEFEKMGFQPNAVVSCLPVKVELDGRSASVRNGATLLTTYSCQCILDETASSGTVVALFDSGQIRVDDILRGTITQYDILRTLPFANNLFALSVPGPILAAVLTENIQYRGAGYFPSYSGVTTPDQGKTWLINDSDISKSGLNYKVATINHAKSQYFANYSASIVVLEEYNITQTKSLIAYLSKIYPPC